MRTTHVWWWSPLQKQPQITLTRASRAFADYAENNNCGQYVHITWPTLKGKNLFSSLEHCAPMRPGLLRNLRSRARSARVCEICVCFWNPEEAG
jgi:hypothetical protein